VFHEQGRDLLSEGCGQWRRWRRQLPEADLEVLVAAHSLHVFGEDLGKLHCVGDAVIVAVRRLLAERLRHLLGHFRKDVVRFELAAQGTDHGVSPRRVHLALREMFLGLGRGGLRRHGRRPLAGASLGAAGVDDGQRN
jgi:hypothetical protein